jgi:hypothetical protein
MLLAINNIINGDNTRLAYALKDHPVVLHG